MIPGVLILEKNKTYGKVKNKYLYKFVPHDSNFDHFLVPYLIKNIGFNKNQKNKYVVIQPNNSDDTSEKHPKGTIIHSIGDVDIIDNFFEYSLWCKNLKIPATNLKKEVKKLANNIDIELIAKKWKCENRSDLNIISIDPKGSKDIDDAFGIQPLENQNGHKLSIYIANVPILLDELSVWNLITSQISTIYLPDKKIAMLPELLSDNLCSLLENKSRIALTLDVFVVNGVVEHVEFKNCLVKLSRNYNYDEIDNDSVVSDVYKIAKEVVVNLNNSEQANYLDQVGNSHDVIAYMMILMNHYASKFLAENDTGIFRSIKSEISKDIHIDDANFKLFLRGWKSSGGGYSLNKDRHDILDLDIYTHVTSPIRRMVDLLNSIAIQYLACKVKFSKEALQFFDDWTTQHNIEFINKQMKSIRKLQVECNLLHVFTNDRDIMNRKYTGYICDSDFRNNKYHYAVYIPDLKMIAIHRTVEQYDLYSKLEYKLYYFKDQGKFRQKILINTI